MDNIIVSQLKEIVKGENDKVANMANAVALLVESMDNVSWVGFYRYDPKKDELILGPYQGKIACIHIANGRGVCGKSLSTGETQRVADVNDFEDHIACDADSASEIVVPIFNDKGKAIGVLDIDSNQKDRFSSEDQQILEEFCEAFSKNIDNLINND